MTRVLVVNHGLHHVCGVHDLGVRLYDAIPDNITKAYVEADTPADMGQAVMEHAPDVVLVNFRPDLMPWMDVGIRQVSGPWYCAVAHNYDKHTLAALHDRHEAIGFDWTLTLEPRLLDLPGVVWSGRPLPPPLRCIRTGDLPVIGSFGFAFGHKRFDRIAHEVAALGTPAVFRLHCPTAHFGGSTDHTDAVIASVRHELEGSDVDLVVTMDHQPAHAVVAMLAACDVNCLLYEPGQPDAGLSSAMDYLLAAGRPILVSEASMFRHAFSTARVWPDDRLGDVLANADEHAARVRARYDELIQGYVDGIRRLVEMA